MSKHQPKKTRPRARRAKQGSLAADSLTPVAMTVGGRKLSQRDIAAGTRAAMSFLSSVSVRRVVPPIVASQPVSALPPDIRAIVVRKKQ